MDWLKFRIVRKSTLDKLKERRKADNKVISNLMSMNHSLIQFFNTLPPKLKKGLSTKAKSAQKG